MSEAQYQAKLIRDVRIPMRDGIGLAARITRPDADGKFPAVMSYSPYQSRGATEPPERDRYLAERGYVVVAYDVRGTGDSEGFSPDMYAPEEIKDGHDAVEWIAGQSWCDGNVGMWGISYGGVAAWQVAMQNPPHLKAIVVRSGTEDAYTDWVYPGGCPRPFNFECYATFMTALNFGPPNIELCADKWAGIWNEHLQKNVPWGIGFIRNQLDGPYWRAKSLRPDYDRVQCAVYVMGGWADWYPTPLLRAFANLKCPKKALIGPWSHQWPEAGIPGPRLDGLHECERWFDHWLKGMDTGIMDEPPVTLFVREYVKPETIVIEDKGSFRAENKWPLAREKQTPMYLRADGLLSTESPQATEAGRDEYEYNPAVGAATGKHGGGPFGPWARPLDQRADEVHSLSYTTPPLEADLEVTGHPRAVLYVSSTADIAYFSVKICDVAPEGTSALVTKGFLNATHRASHAEPSLLEPGKICELTIDLLAVAYRLKAGHRIRIDIASADFLNAWPTSKSAVNAIHRSAKYPSRVILPVAPEQSPRLSEPAHRSSPHPLPALDELRKPEYLVSHDPVNETATYSYKVPVGKGINCGSFTVSQKNPAEAVVKATAEYEVETHHATIAMAVQTVTSSDANAFHHLVEVEAKVNGKRHFNKSWAVSVPREFN